MKEEFAPNDIALNDSDILYTFFATNFDKDILAVRKELLETFGSKQLAENGTLVFKRIYENRMSFAIIEAEGVLCWIKHSRGILQENIFNNQIYPFSETQTYNGYYRIRRKIEIITQR